MEQLSSCERCVSERQSRRDERPSDRARSRRSPHGFGGGVVAARLAVAGSSERISTQPGIKSLLSNRESLLRRVPEDHGPQRRSSHPDEKKPGVGSFVAHY